MSKYKQADLRSEFKSSGGYVKSKGKSSHEKPIRIMTAKDKDRMAKLSR